MWLHSSFQIFTFKRSQKHRFLPEVPKYVHVTALDDHHRIMFAQFYVKANITANILWNHTKNNYLFVFFCCCPSSQIVQPELVCAKFNQEVNGWKNLKKDKWYLVSEEGINFCDLHIFFINELLRSLFSINLQELRKCKTKFGN